MELQVFVSFSFEGGGLLVSLIVECTVIETIVRRWVTITLGTYESWNWLSWVNELDDGD